MMVELGAALALLGAPWQVIVVALIVVGLFAPHFLPKLGRLLGRSLRTEALRRLGLFAPPPSRPPTHRPAPADERVTAQVEILMPESTSSAYPSTPVRRLAAAPTRRRSVPTWLVTTIALSAAAAIFWLLLRAR